MCGIAGFMTGGAPADRNRLRAMCDRLVHRGPDGYGEYFDGSVALGHRRLSIIDLATGDQPLGNEDGSVQVVFNGEIYNYVELRRDLIARGHQFRTQSDTEVLVHLYEDAGERTPEYLNGMFSFALWDAKSRKLLLARDRFGKKPLYYSTAIPGFCVAFASELTALAELPGFNFAVNPESVADFLSLSYVPDPATIYRDVYKLPPAHTATVTDGRTRLRRYWRLDFQPGAETDFRGTVEQVRHLATDAVGGRLMSDVPLGAFLSGGVDSSAVVAMMSAQVSEPVKTFSIGFTHKQFDELEYARLVASRYRTDHREEVVSPSIHEVLDTLVDRYDEPFGDASAIPSLYLARMTRRHVTVALSGDGADEIFGGYRRYAFGIIEERVRRQFPEWFRRSVFRVAGQYYPKFDYLPQVFRAKTTLQNLACGIADAYFTSMTTFRDSGLEAVLSPELREQLRGYSPRLRYRDRFRALPPLPPLEQMQAVDIETYLPGDILVKADRATMAHSLESRSPWLDYRLAELAARMPSEWKVNSRVGKAIFKEAVKDLVPGKILTRSKMGFATPLAEWFRTSLRSAYLATVLSRDMADFVGTAEARRIWDEHQSGLHDHSRKLWNLLMLACWQERHVLRRVHSYATA